MTWCMHQVLCSFTVLREVVLEGYAIPPSSPAIFQEKGQQHKIST